MVWNCEKGFLECKKKIAFTERPYGFLKKYFCKTHSYTLIPNWIRHHVIAHTNMVIIIGMIKSEFHIGTVWTGRKFVSICTAPVQWKRITRCFGCDFIAADVFWHIVFDHIILFFYLLFARFPKLILSFSLYRFFVGRGSW